MSQPIDHYAIHLTPDQGITVQVFPQGRERFHAKLLDEWDNTIVLVHTPWSSAPLERGDALGLQLALSETSDSLWFEGTVRDVEVTDSYVRIEVAVTSGDIRNRLNDGGWAIFNRRRRPRVHFGAESPVVAHLSSESGQPLGRGRLYDLSVSGLCVRVGRTETDALALPGPLRVRFALSRAEDIELLATIRDVRVDEQQLLFGMSLVRGPRDRANETVAAFVARSIL